MSQDMSSRVLRNKVTQVRAKAHVRNGRLVVTPFLDRETLEEDKAFAVYEVRMELDKIFAQIGEGEVDLDCLFHCHQM